MKEDVDKLKKEIEEIKKILKDLDFALKNHEHRNYDKTQKIFLL